jgi:hypothetical protein
MRQLRHVRRLPVKISLQQGTARVTRVLIVSRPNYEKSLVAELLQRIAGASPSTALNGLTTPMEEGSDGKFSSEKDGASYHPAKRRLVQNTSIFTWRKLTYTVRTPSGSRIFLDNIHGYVKPAIL